MNEPIISALREASAALRRIADNLDESIHVRHLTAAEVDAMAPKPAPYVPIDEDREGEEFEAWCRRSGWLPEANPELESHVSSMRDGWFAHARSKVVSFDEDKERKAFDLWWANGLFVDSFASFRAAAWLAWKAHASGAKR